MSDDKIHKLFNDSLAQKGMAASVERHLRAYFAAHGEQLPHAGLYERVISEIERPLITLALTACRGNQLKAAELLGLNRNTLRKKMQQLGIRGGRAAKSSNRQQAA